MGLPIRRYFKPGSRDLPILDQEGIPEVAAAIIQNIESPNTNENQSFEALLKNAKGNNLIRVFFFAKRDIQKMITNKRTNAYATPEEVRKEKSRPTWN